MGLALMMVMVMGGAYATLLIVQAWKRREYQHALGTGKWLLAGIGVYFVALLGFSVTSNDRLAGSEGVQFCGLDGACGTSGAIVRVEHKKTAGNPPRELMADGMYYVVTVKVSSSEANLQVIWSMPMVRLTAAAHRPSGSLPAKLWPNRRSCIRS